MNIQKTNTNFGAKFYNYPNAYDHPDIAKGFEEATKQHPDLVLLQDSISYFEKDHFYLLKGNKVLGFDAVPFTKYRRYLSSSNDIVNKLVGIFNKMLEHKIK